jgi:hypothetical protein
MEVTYLWPPLDDGELSPQVASVLPSGGAPALSLEQEAELERTITEFTAEIMTADTNKVSRQTHSTTIQQFYRYCVFGKIPYRRSEQPPAGAFLW